MAKKTAKPSKAPTLKQRQKKAADFVSSYSDPDYNLNLTVSQWSRDRENWVPEDRIRALEVLLESLFNRLKQIPEAAETIKKLLSH